MRLDEVTERLIVAATSSSSSAGVKPVERSATAAEVTPRSPGSIRRRWGDELSAAPRLYPAERQPDPSDTGGTSMASDTDERTAFGTPPPDPELRRLESLVGTWRAEDHTEDSVLGPGVAVTSTESFYWLDGGYYLVSTYETVFGDEPAQKGLNYWYYDSEAKRGEQEVPRPTAAPRRGARHRRSRGR
jgi:hypothetical protein